MFLENFNKFLKYYGKGRYLKLCGFTGLSFIAGCLEFVGIALIYPFIMLIIKPEALPQMFDFIKIDNSARSGLLIGLSVLIIFILKNAFIIFTQYIQAKFVSNWKQALVNKFMNYFIFAPYKDTMKASQADKLYIIETLTGQVIDNFVLRALNLLTNIIIIVMVVLLLLIKFLIPAIITIIFVCVSLIIQNRYFKSKTNEIAAKSAKRYQQYKTSMLENINNIKELKILSAENIFYNHFVKYAEKLKQIQIKQGFYASIPPYIVEILVVSALLVMACVLSMQNAGDNPELIASFAIVVAALFRIAPALNRIQSAIITINSSRNFVKKLNEVYEKYNLENFEKYDCPSNEKLDFKNTIRLENINFSYNNSKQVIKNISFEIHKGDFIGIIGLSGAGKSTLADIITGLLPVDSGRIIVDNTVLTAQNFAKFRHIIGYVPQQINILDKSFKENVTWGCENIDEKGVIKALKAAQIYNIVEEFSEGIDALAASGENGLSQGQKQRLAIARALYRDPEIIILDEATSALDVQVEHEITETLKQISSSKTIIAIAHRLSTLKACNKLIYMKDGQIVDSGTFEELSQRYEDFNNLVKLSSIN